LITIEFLKILLILLIAIVALQIINSYMLKEDIRRRFKENEKNIVKASAIGVATPGPLIAFLPILKMLKIKGVSLAIIIAFIT